MTQINPSIDKYNIPSMQSQGQQAPRVRIPNYYTQDSFQKPDIKEALNHNPVYEMIVKPFVEHPLSILATWLGAGLLLDAYSTSCSGKYEDSLLKKVANAGDKIEQSKIIQNKPVKAVLKGLGSVKKAGGKVVQNSAILRAMRDTPSRAEWQMAISQQFSHKQEVVQDFIRITEALKLESPEFPVLKELGINGYEKKMLKKTFNVQKISQIPEEQAVNQVLLNRLGRTPAQIQKIQNMGEASAEAVKQEILKEMGLTKDKLKLIREDTYGKYINDVKAATEKVRGRVKMGAGHYKLLGPLTKPFERTIGCDEIYNKLHSMSGGAKTSTGRFMAKMTQMIHRGLTFGGGKLGVLMFIAPLLVELGINVKKADKDQKVGTAANGFIDNISWVFTFPIAFKMMHSIGGIQYAGMTKEQVEQYRKIKNEFNEKAGSGLTDRIKALFGSATIKPGEFKTKAEYDIARQKVEKQLESLTKVKNQNIFTKGLRKFIRILTPDLENFKGYSGGNAGSKFYHGLPHLLKDFVGIPMRFGVFSLISMGILGAALTKCVTAIFGKSYDAMKQDELKENRKQQKQFLKDDLNERIYNIAQNNSVKQASAQTGGKMFTSKGKPAQQAVQEVNKEIETEEENVDNYTYIPSQENVIPAPINSGKTDTYTYIPSSECKIQPDAKTVEGKRKYIPSQEAANIQKTFDNSGLQSVLDKADRAESKALKVLAGNFEGM